MHNYERRSAAWISLPASTDVLHAIGGGHSFESALADIVDNSIDARASRVQIRFITDNIRLVAVQIRDDGTGMTEETLVDAFRLGGRRKYKDTDLGHYGIGMKSASMRQANSLTVYSAVNEHAGLSVTGARLDPDDTPDGTLGIRILDRQRAEFGYSYGYESDPPESGTVVEWTDIRTASDAASQEIRQEWLDRRLESTRAFLGLVFHRILEAGDLRIEIDILEIDGLFAGIPRRIDPVNPFGYQISGRPGYPRRIEGTLPDNTPISAVCHLLPPKGIDRGLSGKREEWQGLYIYRNNRLLTVNAGWQGLCIPKSDLRLARVEVEVDDNLLPYVTPNPEKNGVVLDPEYATALQAAAEPSSGTTFSSYLDEARIAWKESTKRTTEKPLTKISEGIPSSLIQQLGELFGWRNDHTAVSVVWEEISTDHIFRVDLDRRMLVMNSAHASQLDGEDSSQATIVVTLLYMLVEPHFTRASHLRATTLQHLEQVNSVLLTALYSSDDAASMVSPVLRRIPADALAKLRESISNHSGSPDTTESVVSELEALPAGEASAHTNISLPNYDGVPEGPPEEEHVEKELSGLNESEQVSPDVPALEPERASRAFRWLGPSDPLGAEDLAAFEAYCSGAGVGEVAAALGREKTSVAISLALALFGAEATEDDDSLAPFHGLPYTPDERERIINAYRSDSFKSIVAIARENRRTPLAIAWLLLDSPKRPVRLDKRVRKNVRRRLKVDE